MRTVTSRREQILDVLRAADGPMTAMEIATTIGLASVDDAANVLRDMLREKIVSRTNPRRGPARWQLESEQA